MALLAFDEASKSPVGYLMENGQRQKTASALNAAILTIQNQEKGKMKYLKIFSFFSEPKLPILIKLLKWSQMKLEEKVKFPKVNNILSAELDEN